MNKKNEVYNKIYILIGLIFMSILFFIFTAKIFLDTTKLFTNIRLPLEEIKHIAVDEQGNIFLAASFYKRVLMYDKDGIFKRNFPSPYKLNNEFILARNTSENYHLIFQYDKINYKNIIKSSQYNLKINNTKYLIKNDILFPPQIIIQNDSQKITIKFPYIFYIFTPFPAFIFFIIGWIIINYRSKNKRIR